MNRRRYLQVGLVAAANAVFAGCTGGNGGQRDRVRTAASSLQAATQRLRSEASKTEQIAAASPPDVDAGSASTDVERAQSELSAVEEESPTVAAMREATDAVATLTACAATFDEGYAAATAGFDAYEGERYDAAHGRFEAASERFDAVETCLADVDSRVDALDWAALADVEEFDRTELEATLGLLAGATTSLGTLSTGYLDMCLGMQRFRPALAAFRSEQYDAAASKFEAAHGRFDAAATLFERRESEISDRFRDGYETLSCFAFAFRDGSDHLHRSAAAASAGDRDGAREHGQKGRAALGRCETS